MKPTFTSRCNLWLMRTIYLQLYISLISSPILIYWGLPISIAAPLGNILFNPLLIIFLFFSSLVFFTELLYFPNSYLAWMLNQCTTLLDYSTSFGNQQWLVGFAKPHVIILWIIPLATLLIIHYRYNRKRWRGVISLCILSLSVSICLMYTNHPKRVQTIPCNNGSLTLITSDPAVVLIDPGYLGSRMSAPSYIQYTLVPTIIKTAGTMTIDSLILLKFNVTTIKAVIALCQVLSIHTIYLPAQTGAMTDHDQEIWNQCTALARNHNITIFSLASPASIFVGQEHLTISPTQQNIRYKDIVYNTTVVEGIIDGHPLRLYSASPSSSKNRAVHGP